jgi:hypothetical protein
VFAICPSFALGSATMCDCLGLLLDRHDHRPLTPYTNEPVHMTVALRDSQELGGSPWSSPQIALPVGAIDRGGWTLTTAKDGSTVTRVRRK